ncbi:MAG: prolyl oligopeptidase family serine peptidase [Candidatus Limnocylindrales bacterium]
MPRPAATDARPIANPNMRDRLTIEAVVAVAPPTGFRISPDGRSVAYLDEVAGARQVCVLPLRGGPRQQLTALAKDASEVAWSPDDTRLAYVCETAIWVIEADGGRPRRVADHPAGNTSPCWAPDGERLLFISRRRGWSQLWLVDVPRPARGRPPSTERLRVPRCLTPSPHDNELPSWSPDGRWIAFASLRSTDLAAQQICVLDVDAAEGGRHGDAVRIVAGADSMAVAAGWWPDSTALVFTDDREGWFQVARVAPDGDPGSYVTLTSGAVEHGDPSGESPYAPLVSPDGHHVAHVRIHGGLVDLVVAHLTPGGRAIVGEVSVQPEPGVWRLVAWVGTDHLAAVGDTTIRPPDLWLLPVPGLAAAGARPRQVTASLPGAVPVRRFVAPERIRFTARDGLAIQGTLWRPSGPAPAIVAAHGGPTWQTYAGWQPFFELLAQEGMAIVAPDFRGSTGYGRAFRHANVGEWGHADCQDCIDAARWAAAQPWCDGRLAIYGGSYGGYMTLCALVEEPGLWRAGVDLYGDSEIAESFRHGDRIGRLDLERQMGSPDDAAMVDTYRRGSPVYRAERIEAPLLILHGRRDKRVVPLMSERMVEALEIEAKHHEVHWYDDEGHGWKRRENRRDAYERILKFLKRHLLDQEPPPA